MLVFFFGLFDRTSVSRDRDCYGLTEISEILDKHQRFGMRRRFDHFEHSGPVQTGLYSTGKGPPIKAGHRGTIPHLESTCTRFNTSARRRTRPSAGPVRSQQMQILRSLTVTVRQFFSGSAYFSCCANISVGANIFSCAKVWHPPKIWKVPRFWHPPNILDAPRFWHLPKILDAPRFWYLPKILKAPMFLYPPRFLYIFCGAYISVYFSAFLFSMRQ